MISTTRFNQYRIMWLYVFFDLPTTTKAEKKTASKFRQRLLKDGFAMFQYSIYIRHCSSRENANVHENRIRKSLPKSGKVGILTVTDKQFGMMTVFYGRKEIPGPTGADQLELF